MKIGLHHYSLANCSPATQSTGAHSCSRSVTAINAPRRLADFGRFVFTALHAFAAKTGGKTSGKIILPCLALCCCLPSLRADTFGDFNFTDYGSTITIDKYTGSGGAMVIPATINDKPVAYIEYRAFYGCTSITSVTIPSSVIFIGGGAFEGCTSLTSVTIPSSVTYIGGEAFEGCTSLTSVTISSSVTSIKYRAFYGCTSLTSVTIPSSVTTIEVDAFEGCTSLTSVTISSSVTTIEYSAFYGCPKLAEILVDSANPSYASIDGVLFDKLQTTLITYPDGKLQTTYAIPSSVTTIGKVRSLAAPV